MNLAKGMRLLRWGRSSYETDEHLTYEAKSIVDLGFHFQRHLGGSPSLEDVDVLLVNSGVKVTEELMQEANRQPFAFSANTTSCKQCFRYKS